MDVEDLRKLESRATPRPWKGRELVFHGQGQATGPAHEIPDDIRTASVLPWTADCLLIARMRNLAPELLELWEAANLFYVTPGGGVEGLHACQDLESAIKRLNDKAASMAV